MNKKPIEPDEMRMPADEFDEIMRQALGVPPPSEDQDEAAKNAAKHPKASKEKGDKCA